MTIKELEPYLSRICELFWELDQGIERSEEEIMSDMKKAKKELINFINLKK